MNRYKFSVHSFPIAALVVCILAYGLLIPWLGFYFDDWPAIFVVKLGRAQEFLNFYAYDRPFSAWTFLATAPILGASPLIWHIFSLLLRWITVVMMWWCLKSLWPNYYRQATWMALLFAIYPVFDQQVIAVAYSQHWITYILFFISLGLMIHSIRNPKRYWIYMALSLLTGILHMLTMEYFVGLELLRPIIIWFLIAEERQQTHKLRHMVRLWLPYLFLWLFFVLWRAFFLALPDSDPNRLELVYSLTSQPISVILRLVQLGFQDTINLLISAWNRTLEPKAFLLNDASVLFSIAATLVTGGLVAFYLLNFKSDLRENDHLISKRNWLIQAFILGAAAIIFGALPVWLTDRQAIASLYGGRFSLASMFGASILLIAFVEWVTPRRIVQIVIVSTFIAVAVGFHVRRANDFRWYWNKQTRFYWQLYWRAPVIHPGTIIFADGELFSYVGREQTTAALNLLYPLPASTDAMNYWFIELDPYIVKHPEVAFKGTAVERSFRTFKFTGNTIDSIVVYYEPEAGRCLWILSPDDADSPDIPDLARNGIDFSDLSRIGPVPSDANYPPMDIFGSEPEHTWCYYFQKADLARQYKDWQQVVALGEEAQKKRFSPNDPQEWIPFIEGYARLNRWSEPIQWTLQINRTNRFIGPRLCRVWDSILTDNTPPAAITADIQNMRERLECTSP